MCKWVSETLKILTNKTTTITLLQWFLFGYSLAFSKTASPVVGNFDNIFLMDVNDKPNSVNPDIPDMVFCLYQGMFAAITPG